MTIIKPTGNVSRTANAMKNSAWSMALYILQLLFSFANRTFFIRILNADYLGIYGLFSNILTVLSLAELGIGTAIIFAMYKPAAEGDNKKIAAYLAYYGRMYRLVGCVVLAVGLAVFPFLDLLIKGAPDIAEDIHIIYLIILADTVVGYFFAYKRSLLTVYQKERVNQIVSTIGIMARYIVQIAVLLLSHNIYLYFGVQVVTTIATNCVASRLAINENKSLAQYSKETLSNAEKKDLFKNILAMSASKIGSVAVNGTDSILISAFLGITATGIYSNYTYIVTYAKVLMSRAFSAITASVGNLISLKDNGEVYRVFRITTLINSLVAFFSTVFLTTLLNPFILLWAGDSYVLPRSITALIVLNFYFSMMRQSVETFINAYGIFWQLRWKSIVEAILNLIISVVLVAFTNLGLLGIIIGTVASNLLTNVWWEPYALFKYGMKKSARGYYRRYAFDFLCCVCSVIAMEWLSSLFQMTSVAMLMLLRFVVSLVVCIIVFAIRFLPQKDFKEMLHQLKLLRRHREERNSTN